jgi:hypothetical protein
MAAPQGSVSSAVFCVRHCSSSLPPTLSGQSLARSALQTRRASLRRSLRSSKLLRQAAEVLLPLASKHSRLAWPPETPRQNCLRSLRHAVRQPPRDSLVLASGADTTAAGAATALDCTGNFAAGGSARFGAGCCDRAVTLSANERPASATKPPSLSFRVCMPRLPPRPEPDQTILPQSKSYHRTASLGQAASCPPAAPVCA